MASSEPKLGALSASQAASVLWCFARFGFLPAQPYTIALVSQVSAAQFSSADGDALTMTVWSLLTLKAAPLILTLPYAPTKANITGGSKQPAAAAAAAALQASSPDAGILLATAAATAATALELPQAVAGAKSHTGPKGVSKVHLEEPETGAASVAGSSVLAVLASELTLPPSVPSGGGVRGAWVRGWVERLAQLTDTLNAPAVANALWSMAELGEGRTAEMLFACM